MLSKIQKEVELMVCGWKNRTQVRYFLTDGTTDAERSLQKE